MKWSRLVSNQRPSACEADALPLSYETRCAHTMKMVPDSPRRNIITAHPSGRNALVEALRRGICAGSPTSTSVFLRSGRRSRPKRADVAQLVAHHLAKVRVAGSNPVIRSKVQVRHQTQRWSGRVVRQRPAKPCTRVRFPSPPPRVSTRAISSAGERFPDTEEVTGSIPVSRTRVYAGQCR